MSFEVKSNETLSHENSSFNENDRDACNSTYTYFCSICMELPSGFTFIKYSHFIDDVSYKNTTFLTSKNGGTCLKIGSLNTCGLKIKCSYPAFIEFIQSNDILLH